MIGALVADMNALKVELEQLKTLFGNAVHVGPVAALDAEKGYRIRLGGTDDEPYLSPWYPHPETGKTSVPLKMGQVVGRVNHAGDPRIGFLLRGGYSDEHPTPNQNMQANVFHDAGVRIEVVDNKLKVTADEAVTLEIGTNIKFVVPAFDVNPG
ncbi:baseplate assembly protein [Aurantimonas sp. VKM B-3413]|uniref:baseplate assembly protein n=1 Tax=Aurantimonas sp. VKM B-3413 TaxID=2779401 RepID=UPI001E435AC3|nr:baseplate assembly protein [Aurantimonas sp. VKM B-3413]MCB8835941.1 baseplate assembly protein [Aurantimonas sp. VKM B-3413]